MLRNLDKDAGKLVIELFQGRRRMMYVQFNGERILAAECCCGNSVPSMVCPVDQHRWNAIMILNEEGEDAYQ